MANAPVIFDDGGSTRIKQLKDNVKMDGLLGPGAFTATADGDFKNGAVFKCHMKIRMHQDDGDQTVLPAAPPGGNAGIDPQAGDTVVITSQNGQVANITFAGFQMTIDLRANVAGVDP